MIRRNLRRLAARVDATRFWAKPDHRAFIRLAYQLAHQDEPDEDGYRRHEADLARGLSHANLLRGLVEEGLTGPAEGGDQAEHTLSARVPPEDADHLIRLAFRSLLRREPDPDTYADYREAFDRGTTFLDLINDVTHSEEFKIIDERIEHLLAASNHPPPPSPSPALPIASEMSTAVTLLEIRLGEKGCKLQLGARPAGEIDGASAQQRMRSLLVTLSLMEQL